MLVVKVYTTKKVPIREGESVEKGKTFHTELGLIDEIHIQNTGHTLDGTAGEWTIYQIKKPEPDLMDAIFHRRKEGYIPLVRKALKRIDKYRKFPELKESRRMVVSYKDGRARAIWSTHQNINSLEVEGDETSPCHGEESECESRRDCQKIRGEKNGSL